MGGGVPPETLFKPFDKIVAPVKIYMQMVARHGVQNLGHYYVDMVLILFGKIKGSGISGSSCLNSFRD